MAKRTSQSFLPTYARAPACSFLAAHYEPPSLFSIAFLQKWVWDSKKEKENACVRAKAKAKAEFRSLSKATDRWAGQKVGVRLIQTFFLFKFFFVQQLNIFWHFPIFRTSACLLVCCLSLESHWSFFTLIIIRVYVRNFVSYFWSYLTGDNCHLWIKHH